jgi:hypothetical protein
MTCFISLAVTVAEAGMEGGAVVLGQGLVLAMVLATLLVWGCVSFEIVHLFQSQGVFLLWLSANTTQLFLHLSYHPK